MPAAVAIPLAIGAGTAAAGVVGSKLQSNAARDASKMEQQTSERALADAQAQRQWQQAQYANYLERLRPFQQYGLNSANTLNNLLQRSPYTQMANRGMPAPPQVPRPVPPMPMPNPMNGPTNGIWTRGLVGYRAPGSSTMPADNRMTETD